MLSQIFETIDKNVKDWGIDDIIALLQPLFVDHNVRASVIPTGTLIYRARKCEARFCTDKPITLPDLSYAPSHIVEMARINRNKQSLFYCSLMVAPVIFELDNLQKDDEIILSVWQTNHDITVKHIGHTCSANGIHYEQIDFTADRITLANNSLTCNQKNQYLLRYCGHDPLLHAIQNAFIWDVESEESDRYKLSIALAELHAIPHIRDTIYPSSKFWPYADNMAFEPNTVDRFLDFKHAFYMSVQNVDKESVSLDVLHKAFTVADHQIIDWNKDPFYRHSFNDQDKHKTA